MVLGFRWDCQAPVNGCRQLIVIFYSALVVVDFPAWRQQLVPSIMNHHRWPHKTILLQGNFAYSPVIISKLAACIISFDCLSCSWRETMQPRRPREYEAGDHLKQSPSHLTEIKKSL